MATGIGGVAPNGARDDTDGKSSEVFTFKEKCYIKWSSSLLSVLMRCVPTHRCSARALVYLVYVSVHAHKACATCGRPHTVLPAPPRKLGEYVRPLHFVLFAAKPRQSLQEICMHRRSSRGTFAIKAGQQVDGRANGDDWGAPGYQVQLLS